MGGETIEHAERIAVLEAQFKTLNDRIGEMNTELKGARAELHQLNLTLASARGGWKTLLALGSASTAIAGTIMAALWWAYTHLQLKP